MSIGLIWDTVVCLAVLALSIVADNPHLLC
jgi:hypothetical protein